MKTYRILQVNAFSDQAFGGNPAGVVPMAEGLLDWEMQKIAREMNLSETAFVFPHSSDVFRVRYFTPEMEVKLCGHATIAAFWVLVAEGVIRTEREEITVIQKTGVGPLEVTIFLNRGLPERVMMTQASPRVIADIGWDEDLLRILGIPEQPKTSQLPNPHIISTGLPDLIVPLASREDLWALNPDLKELAAFCKEKDIISVHCVTLDTIDPAAVVHCRDFAPAVGINEESATGTAAGATAAFLIKHGLIPHPDNGKFEIALEQGHIMDRPSFLIAEVEIRKGQLATIRVGGAAYVLLDGLLTI